MPGGGALFRWVSVDDPRLYSRTTMFVRVLHGMIPGDANEESVPGAHQDCSAPVPSGSLLHNTRLSLHPGLCGMLPSADGKALRLLRTKTKASWGLEVWQGVT